MARSAKYSRSDILQAAAQLLEQNGPRAVSMSGVARHLGAPSGSIYHRFASRELLLAHLWLESVESFQRQWGQCVRGPDPLESIDFGLNWVAQHPAQARLLLLYRREDLIEGPWPEEVSRAAEALGQQLQELLQGVADNLGQDLERLTFALIDIPYAAMRRALRQGRAPSESLRLLTREAAEALLSGKRMKVRKGTRR